MHIKYVNIELYIVHYARLNKSECTIYTGIRHFSFNYSPGHLFNNDKVRNPLCIYIYIFYTLPHTQYIYSQKLNTFVGIEKDSADTIDGIYRMNIMFYDVTNRSVTFLSCRTDKSIGNYHSLDQGIIGEITENIYGTVKGKNNKVTKFKVAEEDQFWQQLP